MREPLILRTGRLTLTPPDEDDVEAIRLACQDPDVQRWTTVPSPYTREDAERFVELVAGGWRTGEEYNWAVRDATGLVGMIGLSRISDGAAELGYWMSADARGRGYGTEAGCAVVDFALGPMRLERLEWHAVAGNEPSARLARSLGFRYEGTRRRGIRTAGRREDAWLAGLVASDDRAPVGWPVLDG
ncbi:GNAT family N-acetyltransferase [Microbacterium betulae]|uniref:GNAT family N-acetyltransferase n=1 Tax=Microbacterium betulae TaxID=2981139 RepID=A0AA97FID4_9MICO|nr:GNAT family N-acetyltransferase [Microbacterium sp. AB]WOF23771.1 GNAT family N-acetyltransferase [Microbacterium sp. AB]